ncbi:MAG: phage tail protein [Sphingomonas sp.]|nr:phage tail protein [Sphingomonas sp.]
MATLILTAVGTVLGGPIGAAIGAIAGQAIDRNIIFKPKGRQGPRLTELAVQTSSYGTPIPLLFGTMRVAGTVIWSTDLIESKSTSGGKGQPGVTNYSYSASFAVLVSGRAISGIGRIWADGKLLRGAAGDFKTATGFRVHLGDEAQPVDPLIAAAEGIGMANAHRGQAYAVFENFQLADYGNRIPSLTFEVIADPGPVAIGVIAEAVSGGRVDGRAVTQPVTGYSAYGDSLRGVLESLASVSGAWFAPDGARLAMRDSAGDGPEISDMGADSWALGSSAPGGSSPQLRHGAFRRRSVAAIDTVPQTVTVAHYDPARDYQTGLQRARRPGAGRRNERIDVPAAINGSVAKAIAARAIARAEAGRERREIALDWSALGIAPGQTVTLADAPGRWRVSGWSLEAMVLQLRLVRLDCRVGVETSATSGRVLASADSLHGPTILHVFEAPVLDDAVLTTPRLLVAAAGESPGWRRAALLLSSDGGMRWTAAGETALPATLGVVASPVCRAPATLRDLTGSVEVILAHDGMVLASADDAAMDAGANLALLGDELIQFGMAEQHGARRWRLSRLLRGRRGTERAAGSQAIGDRFILIEPDTVKPIEIAVASIGRPLQLLASGIGDLAGPVAATIVPGGYSVRPPAPTHLHAEPTEQGMRITWVRRSRAGWRWIDGVDTPLVEEQEAYRLVISPPGGIPQALDLLEPTCLIPANIALSGTMIDVRQRGFAGESLPDTLILT